MKCLENKTPKDVMIPMTSFGVEKQYEFFLQSFHLFRQAQHIAFRIQGDSHFKSDCHLCLFIY